ncbi:MAG: glycosyltransferase family 4 protein [Chloroflexales bacterium]|nr:glycosyltransferase family 4 protein [Chloroflexales bacterium]
MRIALLTAEYPPQPGGVGDYTRRLAQSLVEIGHDVAVITRDDERLTIHNVINSPEHTNPALGKRTKPHLHTAQLNWGWRCWGDIIAALDHLHPDLLHIQYQTGAYGMHPAVNLLPWRLKRLPGYPPLIVTFHDLLEPYLFPKAGLLRRWVTLHLAQDADAVIVTNADDAQQLAQHSQQRIPALLPRSTRPPAQMNVIPIGSNIPYAPPPDYARHAWRERLGVGQDDVLVAYFGLVSPSKGLDVLLDALALWHGAAVSRLLLIGGAATTPQDRAFAAAIQTQIERLDLTERVICTGHVDEAMVSAYLLTADCVALPFRDGASLRRGSLLAALGHGCAIVTTQGAQSQSRALTNTSLANEEHVLFVPPGDAAALTTALLRLSVDDALRARLRDAAAAFGARFDWKKIARGHETLYERIIRTVQASCSQLHKSL